MSEMKKVLVFGATGQQGGAVVKALLVKGHHVIGLTRNKNSEKAKMLSDSGVDMREGNFHSAGELVDLMAEVDTVFAMTTPFEEGVVKETQQGIAIAEAAASAQVQHFIFNSVASADKATGIPHFDSKYEVEQHIMQLGLPYTIVAPVYFMDNIISPWAIDMVKTGNVSMAIPNERLLQQIAVQDIAQIVMAIINRPEDFTGKRIDIAGDELSGNQMVEILNRVTGKSFHYQGFSPDFIRETSEDLAIMFEWFDKVCYSTDIAQLKEDFPEVNFTSFHDYVASLDWSFVS